MHRYLQGPTRQRRLEYEPVVAFSAIETKLPLPEISEPELLHDR